ncbi:MAG: hypothetical protein ACJ75J_16845 [Cytophagaceae bacterium]
MKHLTITHSKPSKPIDFILIAVQFAVITIGLGYHSWKTYGHYNALQSPFIPEYIVWEILRPDFVYIGYYILIIIISAVLIIYRYSGTLLLILILSTLVIEYLLINLIGEITVQFGITK